MPDRKHDASKPGEPPDAPDLWVTCIDPRVRDEHHEGVRVVYTTRCERCDARDRGEPDVPDGCGPMPTDADPAGEG